MAFKLPELPYAKDSLAPVISAETIEFHYGKHHQAYVNNLNNLVPGTPFEGKELEEIIKTAPAGGVYNNAAQVWNHTFYWNCLHAYGKKSTPNEALMNAIVKDFGVFEDFKKKFADAAAKQFGSGWAWLVLKEDGNLAIETTSNAGNPMSISKNKPLLTIDVWEHAYYIDYRNARPAYLNSIWDLVNWDFVGANFVRS